MDRPRHRRRDPQRTGPIRNAGEAFRDAEPRYYDSAWRRDDAASRGVREGYRLIDEQIRRGHRMAQAIDEDDRSGGSPYQERRRRSRYDEEDRRHRERDGYHFLEMPMRHIEQLAREILRQIVSARPNPWRVAELILRLQLEAVSELARVGFSALGGFGPRWDDPFDDDIERIERDIDEVEEEIWEEERERERWHWHEAPSSPTTIRSSVPIPVFVSSHEQTEIDLHLPPGSQSLELEVEHPLVSGTDHPTPPAPAAFDAEFVTFAYGPMILCIKVPRDLPAGRYRRRILVRATGEHIGDLTVQVGAIPKTRPKTRKQ